jgi:predicted TIM-barrel fold metal-dependent hydrolase
MRVSDWLTRTPEEHIEYDVDVLFGAWPSHPTDSTIAEIQGRLKQSEIRRALVISTKGALFDAAAGNAETLAVASQELIPVGTVDLRDAVGVGERLDELVAQGVKCLRLFTALQGVAAGTPAYEHVVGEALSRRMVLLQDGDPRVFGPVLAGRGAAVVFLDLHVYLLTDFLLLAKEEPGFRITTRMLSSPDGIERVVETVGAEHLVFGSRTPFIDVSPQTLRLRYARIGAEDRALIAGGNMKELLG